jgi:hypothetical protein
MDTAKNFERGFIMALFAAMLVSQRAFIERLQAQLIEVQAAIYGGDRFKEEGGQVVDYGSHLPGFSLDKDGLLRASMVNISGRFKADSLEAGPLSVSESTPTGVTRFFSANETAKNIISTVREYGIFNATGTYGNLSLNQIQFIHTITMDSSYPYVYTYYTYDVYVFVNNSRVQVAKTVRKGRTNVTNNAYDESENHSPRLANSLNFSITLTGKTMKFHDLPTSVPAEPGTVFRVGDSNGAAFLKVKE